MTAPSDEACVEAYQREIDYVFRTLRRLGVSPSEVDDLAQEVLLALRQSWGEYDPTRPLRPYLFGIAFRIVEGVDIEGEIVAERPGQPADRRDGLRLLRSSLAP